MPLVLAYRGARDPAIVSTVAGVTAADLVIQSYGAGPPQASLLVYSLASNLLEQAVLPTLRTALGAGVAVEHDATRLDYLDKANGSRV